ncbi:MAG: calcium-translocating P-type ATPase, PMCA-type [Bacilli bacterium]|nr:calcium-translocating P-type ATPase, PMCA-type [Bacilli bacterium]
MLTKKSFEQVANELQTNIETGLSTSEATKRLEQYGPNALKEKKKTPLIVRFLAQFKDFLVIILLIAAIISVVINPEEWIESLIILIVVMINAILGTWQESKAEKSLEALKKLSTPNAKVWRDGEVISVKSSDLVPGDIINIDAGDFVPADCRLIEAASLVVDESALTGESVPVTKETGIIEKEDVSLGDMHNCLFSSTYVTYGRGKAIVTGTGMETEIGKIASSLMEGEKEVTPLQLKLDQIGKFIGLICIVVCLVVLGMELLSGVKFADAFMTAIALTVASIPEGLATVVTVVLAIGVEKMVKKQAIVKKLPAVETLGCASVICSDKTGTLTQNKMTVVEFYNNGVHAITDPLTEEASKMLEFFSICTDASSTVVDGVRKDIGDPTEVALIVACQNFVKEPVYAKYARIEDLPFDSDRKMMSVILDYEGKYLVITKGAPDVIMSHCHNRAAEEANMLEANNLMASKALRVLGVGYKVLDKLPTEVTIETIENDLTFLGLVGMIDPARPEVKEAIKLAAHAGIRTVMITGDHVSTAKAIAKELNILRDGDIALSSAELKALSDEELYENIEKYSVYARVAPEDKVRIVKAWQSKGHVVAMTGDGVNDSPALKRADIGCAMGITGTDVAKEAADVVLVDDNFQTIVSAVHQGRGIYANIKKVVKYLLSSNIGEVLTIFLASLISLISTNIDFGVPLLAIHLLWVNLITDSLPAFALGTEEPEDDVMDEKPRPKNESFFANGMGLTIVLEGIMIGLITLTAYIIGHTMSPYSALGQTMAFVTLSSAQLVHSFNVKSDHSIFSKKTFNNKFLIGSFTLGMLLQFAIIYIKPFATIFKVQALSIVELGICLGLSFATVVIVEIGKLIGRQKKKHNK